MKNLFLCFILFFCSCESDFFEAEPANNPPAIFDEMWNGFREYYGPFEERQVNWEAVRTKYQPRVSNQMSEEALYGVLTEMLAELNDGHVRLIVPGKLDFWSNRFYREKIDFDLFDLNLIKKKYLKESFVDSEFGSYFYGLIDNNIIYYRASAIDEEMAGLEKALDKYPAAKGMIIDLRHSRGGDFTWAFPYLGRFTDQKRLVFSSATRNGPNPNDFTPWFNWHLEPRGTHFNKPLVVLTDRFCISAAERTVMGLDVLPQTKIIGDTTNGALSTLIGRELQNGWHYSVAPQKVKFADGKSYEGIGIIPDIPLKNNRAHFARGIDDILERAIHELK